MQSKLKRKHEEDLTKLIEKYCRKNRLLHKNQVLSVLLAVYTKRTVEVVMQETKGLVELSGGVRLNEEEPLATPVHIFRWSVRITNAFLNTEITTLGQLTRLTEKQLRRIRKLGRLSVDYIKDTIGTFGFALNTKSKAGQQEVEIIRGLSVRASSVFFLTYPYKGIFEDIKTSFPTIRDFENATEDTKRNVVREFCKNQEIDLAEAERILQELKTALTAMGL